MCPGLLYVAHRFLKELGSFTKVADNFRKEKSCHSGAVGSQPCSSFHAQNVMRITKCLLCSWILNIRRENHKFFKACIHLWKSKVQYEKCWLHINECFSWKSIKKTINSRMGKNPHHMSTYITMKSQMFQNIRWKYFSLLQISPISR